MRIIAFLTAAGLLACLTGCGHREQQAPTASPEPQITTVEVSYDELLDSKTVTRTITLAVGDILKVVLASNPSTGFRWTSQTRIADPAVVKQISHVSTGPTSSSAGAPGAEVWTFAALKTGTTTIATDYSQPWPGGTQEAATFKAQVTVV